LAAGPVAADVVVVEAKNAPTYRPGTILAGGTIVTLKTGAHLTVIDQSNRGWTITGPWQAPVGDPGGGPWLEKIAEILLSGRRDLPDTSRGGGDHPEGPALLDVGLSGTRCAAPGGSPGFWRPAAKADAAFVLVDLDTNGRVRGLWPAGAESLAWPADLAVSFEHEYQILSVDGGIDSRFRLREDPGTGDITPAAAAGLHDRGCLIQAVTTVKTLAKRGGEGPH
jgi:hypothetical protein